ncbi:MAG: hypothetical protein AAGE98_13955 [Actinomycetota bacterium]
MRRDWILAIVVVLASVGAGAWYVADSREPDPLALRLTTTVEPAVRSVGGLRSPDVAPRTIDPYRGYGTWVDVFDFSPPYAGATPSVTPADLPAMAEAGVRTVYLQAARLDGRSPGGLEDPWLLAEFLLAAEAQGIEVVAWYLPKFPGDGTDEERIDLLASYQVLGRRFAGVGVDIEWTNDNDDETRTARLIELSDTIDANHPDLPLSAIVLPPVLIEVVNEAFWPGFPWAEIADHYDVWQPMSYWSFRSQSSGYGDGYAYNEESVRRLRANIGDPDALVHPIGGIGGIDGIDDPENPQEPLASIEEIERFADSVRDTGSIGASMYDWATLDDAARTRLAELFGDG